MCKNIEEILNSIRHRQIFSYIGIHFHNDIHIVYRTVTISACLADLLAKKLFSPTENE